MAEINYTYLRYNGTSWDTLYPKTTASQVIQTNTRVFLHPTINTVNGKTFGSITGSTWTPSSIVLYGSDILVSDDEAQSITDAIGKLRIDIKKSVVNSGDLTANYIVVGNGTNSVKISSFRPSTELHYISGSFPSSGAQSSLPNASAILAFLGSEYTGASSINTVGTITTGVWNGSVIDIAHGGTGASTAAAARINLGLGSAAVKNVSSTVASGDTNLVTSGAVYNALAALKQFNIIVSNSAGNTPAGVTWENDEGEAVTGTLQASADTMQTIYLVPHTHDSKDSYDEYLTTYVNSAYSWEKIGNTDVDLSGYVKIGTFAVGPDNGFIAMSKNTTDTLYADTYTIFDTYEDGMVNNIIAPAATIYSGVNTQISTALAAFTGNTNINTVGTITNGTWQGSPIQSAYIGNLASNKITSLTGYSEAATYSDLTTSDSLNVALGKLQKGISNVMDRNATKVYYSTSTASITGMQTGDLCILYDA